MSEEWKDIPGFEGEYQVSRSGVVRSFGVVGARGYKHPPQVMKQHLGNGYWVVFLGGLRRKTRKLVHRLIAEAFIPNPEGKPFINHKDGNKANNSLSNLEWCTHQENMRHAHDIGLAPRSCRIQPGEKCPAAKLTEREVREIKRRLALGEGDKEIAADFDVVYGTISHIRRGDTWANVK